MDTIYDKVPVIIPALNPDNRIFIFIKSLQEKGFDRIVVVDDGSERESAKEIFDKLPEYDVTVIGYDHTKGKGCALKSGLSYVYVNMPSCVGVVTADYDGRQNADAVALVADKLLEGKQFVLGKRDLANSNISKGMRRGYKLTQYVFRILYTKEIKDIQTGLRGIALSLIPEFLEIRGKRYEYEPKMIVEAVRHDIPIEQVDAGVIHPIDTGDSTIQISENYRTFADSFRISVALFMNFLEYALVSITATIVDFILFYLLSEFVFADMDLSICVFLSTVCARAVSATLTFSVNRRVVFKSDNNLARTIVLYYILAAFIMLCSAELVTLFVYLFGGNKTFTKLFVDLCLFFLSYQIQQRVIFKKK
ncbi:MAG: GtrA family protein [Lachnospiraceae bacterium]|nr:GtrA family protein [Lachnospiraceae bacterium]